MKWSLGTSQTGAVRGDEVDGRRRAERERETRQSGRDSHTSSRSSIRQYHSLPPPLGLISGTWRRGWMGHIGGRGTPSPRRCPRRRLSCGRGAVISLPPPPPALASAAPLTAAHRRTNRMTNGMNTGVERDNTGNRDTNGCQRMYGIMWYEYIHT